MKGTGLVLGGGGVTGEAFHRGVLRAVHDELGIDARRADVVVGTSAGAIVAASLRRVARAATAVVEETLPEHRLSPWPAVGALAAAALRPWRARPGVLVSSLIPPSGQSTDFLTTGLTNRHGDGWPEQDTWVVAVRRRDGRRVVFGRGRAPRTSVAQAVAASCAIPGYFRPVVIDGEAYVDGGAHSPTNADVLSRRRDLGLVLVSSPMSVAITRSLRPRLDLSLRLMWHQHLAAELRRLRRTGAEVVAFEPHGELLGLLGVNMLRGDRIDQIEELSYLEARQTLGRRALSLAG
jgi:NTE family protein